MEIKSLIERIEKSEGASLVLDRDIALTQYPDARPLPNNDARISIWDGNGRTLRTVKPYTASIDAAMTLVPEGAHCGMGYDSPREGETVGRAWAWVRCKVNGKWEETPIDWRGHRPPSIALALCAASLRARASEGER